MARIPIESPLTYLARHTFPEYQMLMPEGQAFNRRIGSVGQITPERQAEFDEWWARHASLPNEELMPLVADARAKEAEQQARRIEAKERGRFFNQPDAAADFDYWSKMAHWSIDEAVALSLGKSPPLVNQKSIQQFAVPDFERTPASPLAIEYLRRMELAKRSAAWKQLFDPVLPTIFLAWARRLQLQVPPALVSAVEARGLWIADWKDAYDKQKQLSETWEAEAKCHESKAAELGSALARMISERDDLKGQLKASPRPELLTRERETLFKLVIGMAVEGYRYDPEAARNEAPGEIAGDLAKLGLDITDDTVRKWLKDAAATVLPRTQRKD